MNMRNERMMGAVSRLLAPALLLGLMLASPALGDIEREISVSPDGTLELELEAGATVEISGWGKDSIRVVGKVGRSSSAVDIEVVETRRGVRVSTEFRHHASHQNSSIDLIIQVPHHYNLDLDSMGGGLKLEDLLGRFEGETMGGELHLRNIRGVVRLKTMGGNITLIDSEVDGSLKTMGGKVIFEDVSGDVNGSSMGGNVVYRNVRRKDGSSTGSAVVISTMGGEINVSDAPDGADVSTMGGNIRIHSAGRFVKAKTMGGDLQIDKVDGWVKATTMAGDERVVMVGNPRSGERNVDLRSYSGDIELVVPDGLDMDIDIELAYTKDSKRDYKIISDFPLNQRETDEWDRSHGSPRRYIYATGQVGSGSNRIHIKTINGNVRLRRGR